MGLLLDLGLLGVLCLGAAPFLALVAGKLGDWTSVKIVICTAAMLTALGVVGALGKGRHSRRLDDLPIWAALPFLYAVWVALLYFNRGALTLEDCGHAVWLALGTFFIVSIEHLFDCFTRWSHAGLENSPTVPKWVTTPCLAVAAGAAFWFGMYVQEPVFHVLGALLTLVALWSLKAPPFKL